MSLRRGGARAKLDASVQAALGFQMLLTGSWQSVIDAEITD